MAILETVVLVMAYRRMCSALNDGYNIACSSVGVSAGYDAALDRREQLGRLRMALLSLFSELSEAEKIEVITELEKMAG